MLWGKYHNDLTIPSYELLVVKNFPFLQCRKNLHIALEHGEILTTHWGSCRLFKSPCVAQFSIPHSKNPQ